MFYNNILYSVSNIMQCCLYYIINCSSRVNQVAVCLMITLFLQSLARYHISLFMYAIPYNNLIIRKISGFKTLHL